MSKTPPLPPQTRFYSTQGPPTAGDQTQVAPTPVVQLHPLFDTENPNVLTSNTLTSTLQPATTLQTPISEVLSTTSEALVIPVLSRSRNMLKRLSTAVVYCEANFGGIDGKTANGLVRHSEKYEILSVIDSEKAGLDTGMVLDGKANLIPICRDLDDALSRADGVPDFFIFGMAPSSGMLSPAERILLLDAMGFGMNIVNGLHEFLNDDPEFAAAGRAHNVTMLDVRRPRAKKDLRMFSGRIAEVTCPRIAVLGTDCAIGKRTTATILARALQDRGMNVVLVGTGQTGLIQGARYGIALDAVLRWGTGGDHHRSISG